MTHAAVEILRTTPVPGVAPDIAQYKRALAKFPTGVAIVTAWGREGNPVGLTVNSFVSISLDPAVVAWSLRLKSSLYHHFTEADGFAVNVLSGDQASIANRFATSVEDRFAGIAWAAGEGSCPVLEGAAAVFQCEVVSSHVIGDHIVFFGGIVGFSGSERDPLIMHSGKLIS